MLVRAYSCPALLSSLVLVFLLLSTAAFTAEAKTALSNRTRIVYLLRRAQPACRPSTSCSPTPLPSSVWFCRHAEAWKNTIAGDADASSPDVDALTPLGFNQAAETAQWLASRPGCCAAVLTAAENRCQQTAAAITAALGLATSATVDANLTSKRPHNQETPEDRAKRGLAAVARFLAATNNDAGDVVVVSHGQLTELMVHFSSGRPLQNADGTLPEAGVGQVIAMRAVVAPAASSPPQQQGSSTAATVEAARTDRGRGSSSAEAAVAGEGRMVTSLVGDYDDGLDENRRVYY